MHSSPDELWKRIVVVHNTAKALYLFAEEQGPGFKRLLQPDNEWKNSAELKAPIETPEEVQSDPLESEAALPAEVASSGPWSMFRGKLHLGPYELECHVLNDHRRVFTQREIVKVLSGGGRESGGLSRYIDNIPLDTSDLSAVPAIQFKIPGSGNDAVGREAEF